MRRIKLVIFDLDGTLVDSLGEIVAAINHVHDVFRLPHLTENNIREILGSGRRLVDTLFQDAKKAERERAQELYLSYSDTNLLKSLRTYPRVAETLAELKHDGVLMAVISNKHSRLSGKILSRLGMDSYFSDIIGPDSLPFCKPSPGPVFKLLRDLSVDTCDGIVVGDSISDIQAGKNAGVVTVGCSYGYGSPSGLAYADYRIASMPELLKLPLFHENLRLKNPEHRIIV